MRRIDTTLVKNKVAAELRRAILYGDFAPFEELNQDRIAADLGVSRMPVREAVQMLESYGLVTVRHNRAPIVNEITEQFIRDHFDIRVLLEKEAIVRAASRKDIDCAELEECHKKAGEAIRKDDYQAFNLYNGRIHQLVWRLSGSVRLEQLLSQMWNTMHVDSFARENALASNAGHGKMIGCIKNRDAAGAAEAIGEHVRHSCERAIAIRRERRKQEEDASPL